MQLANHTCSLDAVWVIQNGCYMPPEAPGYSCEMKEESLQQYEFPDGAVWQRLRNQS